MNRVDYSSGCTTLCKICTTPFEAGISISITFAPFSFNLSEINISLAVKI